MANELSELDDEVAGQSSYASELGFAVGLGYDVLAEVWKQSEIRVIGGAGSALLTTIEYASDSNGLTVGEVVGTTAGLVSGLIGGAVVTYVRRDPYVGALAGAWIAETIQGMVADKIDNIIDSWAALNDPDGGFNGKGVVARSYGSAYVPDKVFSTPGGPETGIPVGHEFNQLDLISERDYRHNLMDPNGTYRPDNSIRTPAEWREYWDDQPDVGPFSTDPSRPGSIHPSGLIGSAINETRPGFSEPSSSGFAGRGINDVEGPESVSSSRSATQASTGTGGGLKPGQTQNVTKNVETPSGTKQVTQRVDYAGRTEDDPKFTGVQPVLLDLDGDGIEITSLDKSTRFVDAGGQGLQHRTAWAGNGDGVLFIDADGNGALSNSHEYIFTEWDASADDDMAALRSAFDRNGDGKLTSADTRRGAFRVLRTKPDGSTEVKTLAQLGITGINLKADTTQIELPDGSVINGQATFVVNGSMRTSASVSLMAEVQGATDSTSCPAPAPTTSFQRMAFVPLRRAVPGNGGRDAERWRAQRRCSKRRRSFGRTVRKTQSLKCGRMHECRK